MKKILLAVFMSLLLCKPLFAVDTKVSAVTEDTAPTTDDLIYTVNNPGGTPASRHSTFANAAKAIVSGNNTEVQYNASGVFGGDPNFTYNPTTNLASIDSVKLRYDEELQNDLDGDLCIENVGGTYAGNTICFDVEEEFAGVRIKCDGPTTNDNCVFDDVVLMGDNVDFTFGNQSDNRIRHSSTNELFQFATKVDESNDADYGVITMSIDRSNLGVTANQEIFEIGSGGSDDSDANFTEKLALDQEGDLTIAGSITANGSGNSQTTNLIVTTVLDIPSDADPTVDAEGEIAIDTTEVQVVFYDGTDVEVLDSREFAGGAIAEAGTGDSVYLFKAPFDLTIQSVNCIAKSQVGITTWTADVNIKECSATGASCATIDAAITCDNDGAADDGALSNATIDANDWVVADIDTSTGWPWTTFTINYKIDRK